MESALEGKIFDKLNSFFDDYCLNSLQRAAALNFIKEKVANPEDSSVARVREWLLAQLNSRRIPPVHERQIGCPEIIPGLRAHPWWDLSEFNWIEQVEAAYEDIRDELLALRNKGGFQPYRGPTWASSIQAADNVGSLSHDSGQWNVFYLYLHGMSFDENLEKCPVTAHIIKNVIPRHYDHAFFSAVNPGTHIMEHHGPTNKKLRLHFPLIGSEGT